MKKLIAWILMVVMLFSVSACGSAPSEEGAASDPNQGSNSAETEPEEDADSDHEQGDSAEPKEDSPEAEGNTCTLNGMTFVIPDTATYSEDEDSVLATVELEPTRRRISIVCNDLSSFDPENWDMLNQYSIEAWLGNFEVSDQENYTTTVAGEAAQAATATISNENITVQCVLTVLIHEGTQYLFAYLESSDAVGDSTEYFNILDSITFDA